MSLEDLQALVAKNAEAIAAHNEALATHTSVLEKLESLVATNSRALADQSIQINTYQKASNQVVNLAFSLIVAAVLAIILPVVVKL